MPLFGHHKNRDAADTHGRKHGVHGTDTTTAPVGGGGYNQQNMMGAGLGHDEPYNDFNNAGTGAGGLNGPGHHQAQVPAAGAGAGTGTYGHGQGRHAPGHNVQGQYADGGYGGGQYSNAGGIPPTGTLNNPEHSRGGAGQALTGKVERSIGSLVGSNALKAKGLQKEQEANAIKMQGSELAEAERLEREALLRRERAVGHGAHPENKHLGAGFSSGPGGVSGAGGAMPGGY